MNWILVMAAFTLAGCASAKKQNAVETPSTPAAKATAQVTPPAAVAELMKFSCTKHDEIRILEVAKKGVGCTLDYTRGGKMKSVATGSTGLKHCVDSQKKLKTKLEHAGFKCT